MIDINAWLDDFQGALVGTFGDRLWFVGLQGSYARGEATDESDIDVVVILDELTPQDIERYDEMLTALPYRTLVCGFLSGKRELLGWDSADLFQFYHDTKPLFGTLDELLPLLDPPSVKRAIKLGACNIYHGCVHNMLHEKSITLLTGLYKSAFFTLQALCFVQTGRYVSHLKELLPLLSEEEQAILTTLTRLKNGEAVDFKAASEMLFAFAKAKIEQTEVK